MAQKNLLAATGCATGIAHTFMAQEAIEQEAKKRGYNIKVETHGQTGIEHALTKEDIENADGIIIASDIDVDDGRFAGKKVIKVPVARGIKEPGVLIDKVLDPNLKPFKPAGGASTGPVEESGSQGAGIGNLIYTSLMNGVSHMLPLVVAGGVLIAISFFWGIYSADPKNEQYNYFAYILNTIGSTTMGLMVPVLSAYIGESIAKRSGLIVAFATGMIAMNNGTGFLGGIAGGFLAGYVVLLLQRLLKPLPDKEFRGLKAIFLYPVLGVFLSGLIMWFLSSPMSDFNSWLMTSLSHLQNADPIILGIVVGAMSASDFGGPINKAAYVTGTALLAQGNFYFMAGVSAACIAPPLATTFAVLLNPKAYSKSERSAGYVNALLGSTHITEGAIPFAAKHPLLNIPCFMVGAAIAAALTYVSKITVPAPHGGFIVLPLVNKPFLWVLWILIGALVSGILLAIVAGKQSKKHGVVAAAGGIDVFTGEVIEAEEPEQMPSAATTEETKLEAEHHDPGDILAKENIFLDVTAASRDEVLNYLANKAKELNLASNTSAVLTKYLAREDEGSTGMEQGIAIPHAQDESITKSAMLVLKLKQPVKWKTFDDKPVDTIISFLIPEEDSGNHLQYLSNTAKLLTHQQFIDSLHSANTVDEIYNLFK